VFANLGYAYYANGVKVGEATVFGVAPYYRFRLVADQTDGASLGLALANDSDISENYTVTLRRSDGTVFATMPLTLPAKQSMARFLTQFVPSSANQNLEVEVRSTTFSDSLAVVGLRYTGPVFSTIPAN
jgi:hypothetical protein